MTLDGRNDNEEVAEQRRKSFRRILGAGGLAFGTHLSSGVWLKPVVETVALPAHASTTPSEEPHFDDSIEDPCFITLTCGGSGQGPFSIEVNGSVVPPTPDVVVDIDIRFDGGTFEDFAEPMTNENGEYEAGPVDYSDSAGEVEVRVRLPGFPEAEPAFCSIDTSGGDGVLESGVTGYSTSSDDDNFCMSIEIGP